MRVTNHNYELIFQMHVTHTTYDQVVSVLLHFFDL